MPSSVLSPDIVTSDGVVADHLLDDPRQHDGSVDVAGVLLAVVRVELAGAVGGRPGRRAAWRPPRARRRPARPAGRERRGAARGAESTCRAHAPRRSSRDRRHRRLGAVPSGAMRTGHLIAATPRSPPGRRRLRHRPAVQGRPAASGRTRASSPPGRVLHPGRAADRAAGQLLRRRRADHQRALSVDAVGGPRLQRHPHRLGDAEDPLPQGQARAQLPAQAPREVGKVVQTIPMPGVSGGIAMADDNRTAYVSGVARLAVPRPEGRRDVPGREGDVIHVLRYDGTTGLAERVDHDRRPAARRARRRSRTSRPSRRPSRRGRATSPSRRDGRRCWSRSTSPTTPRSSTPHQAGPLRRRSAPIPTAPRSPTTGASAWSPTRSTGPSA